MSVMRLQPVAAALALLTLLPVARIDAQPAAATTQRDPAQIRERFMRGIGVRS
jgi:hypothetical protein